MFKMECVVEDKNLGKAYRALVGIAVGAPTAVPLTEAAVKQGRVVSTNPTGLNGSDRAYNLIRQMRLEKVTTVELYDVFARLGLAKGSYAFARAKMREKGYLGEPKSVKSGIGSGLRGRLSEYPVLTVNTEGSNNG